MNKAQVFPALPVDRIDAGAAPLLAMLGALPGVVAPLYDGAEFAPAIDEVLSCLREVCCVACHCLAHTAAAESLL